MHAGWPCTLQMPRQLLLPSPGSSGLKAAAAPSQAHLFSLPRILALDLTAVRPTCLALFYDVEGTMGWVLPESLMHA